MRGFSFISPRCDARGPYREHAYSSMFEYCVEALHMSEAEAYLRIRAARLGREFPRVLLMPEAGELHLTAIKLLAPVLTQHNADELLEMACFKSKRELEVLLAARFQKLDVSNSIRRLPRPSATREDTPAPLALEATAPGPLAHPSVPKPEPAAESQFRLQALPDRGAGARPVDCRPHGPIRTGRTFTRATRRSVRRHPRVAYHHMIAEIMKLSSSGGRTSAGQEGATLSP